MKKNTKTPTILSTIDNCMIYNMFVSHQKDISAKDLMLLQNFRKEARQFSMSYYLRSAAVVRCVRHRPDSVFVWISLYEQFGKEFLDLVRQSKTEKAAKQIENLLAHAEQYFLNTEA